jgi:hypothetical protein
MGLQNRNGSKTIKKIYDTRSDGVWIKKDSSGHNGMRKGLGPRKRGDWERREEPKWEKE